MGKEILPAGSKRCRACKGVKNIESEFYTRKSGVVSSECRECIKPKSAKRYKETRETEEFKKGAVKRQMRYIRSKQLAICEYLQDKVCEDCESDEYYLFDFHHLDPSQKDFNVTTKIASLPIEVIFAEIAKCAILCRNCHARRHMIEQQSYRYCHYMKTKGPSEEGPND